MNTERVQTKVFVSVTCVIIGFSIPAIISALVFHDHHHRKVFIGSVGLLASTTMYGSPLVVMVSHLFSDYFKSMQDVACIHASSCFAVLQFLLQIFYTHNNLSDFYYVNH
jgi:ABC-type spermidine/putrescine transport system permease subunit I